MNNVIIPIIVAVINSLSPSNKIAASSGETQEETLARYESIARDLVKVAGDKSVKSVYEGPRSRVKMIALEVAISRKESNFLKGVDNGEIRGDNGNSWCLAQIHTAGGRVVIKADGSFGYSTTEGWRGIDLVTDRTRCFKISAAIAQISFKCPNTDKYSKLNLYASGKCDAGYWQSKERIELAEEVDEKLTFTDDDIESFLAQERI
jgi:hypothetical protein